MINYTNSKKYKTSNGSKCVHEANNKNGSINSNDFLLLTGEPSYVKLTCLLLLLHLLISYNVHKAGDIWLF